MVEISETLFVDLVLTDSELRDALVLGKNDGEKVADLTSEVVVGKVKTIAELLTLEGLHDSGHPLVLEVVVCDINELEPLVFREVRLPELGSARGETDISQDEELEFPSVDDHQSAQIFRSIVVVDQRVV